MKKMLLKLVAVIMVATLSLGTAVSCGLFTVNTDRDMQQVVASVRIDSNIDADNITKKELISGFLSYGYSYVQNYSYSTSAAYELVLDNLINNSIIVQQSRLKLSSTYKGLLPSAETRTTTINGLYNKNYLPLFATESDICEFEKSGHSDYYKELNEFMYNRYKDKAEVGVNDSPIMYVSELNIYKTISSIVDSVNSLIDSFADDEDESEENEYEKISYSARTTPTMTEEEKEDDIADYQDKHIDVAGDRTTYLAKAYDRLKALGLISSDETYDAKNEISIMGLSYFKDSVLASLESEMVSLYETGLKNSSNIDYTKVDEIISDATEAGKKKSELADNLWEQYLDLQRKQEAGFKGNYSSFETELGNVSDSSFVVYNSGLGYAYVSHLVVEYSSEQKTVISDITGKDGTTTEQINNDIDAFVKNITVVDQRSSWVQSNYGTYKNGEFTFSDKYVYDTEGVLAKYNGTIGSVKSYITKDEDDNDVYNLQYYGVKPNELGYTEFATIAAQAITGLDSASALSLNSTEKLDGYADEDYRIKKEDFNRFEDLKFAFSIDTGNFNKYLGYVYSPLTCSDTYVKAFAKATAEVVANGVGSYRMFASSEYGLHIVLCTATENYGYYSDKTAFVADLDAAIGKTGDKESVAYLFMKANVDLVTNTYISDIAQSFINKFTAEGAVIDGTKDLVVTKYSKTYKDLITE